MLRGRKSIQDAMQQNDHKHVYKGKTFKNNSNNKNNNYTGNSGNENMQGKHFSQSSRVEYLNESTNSFAASTASLLSQADQQQIQQQKQLQEPHTVLTQRGFTFKRSRYIAATSTKSITSSMPTAAAAATAVTTMTAATTTLMNSRIIGGGFNGFDTAKRNYTKLQFPGGARWRTLNPNILQVSQTPRELQQANSNYNYSTNNNNSISKSKNKNSIRRMRRPYQWLPTHNTFDNSNDKINDEAMTMATATATATGIDDNQLNVPFGEDFQKSSFTEKGKAFFYEFLEGSSIHGFIYLAKFGLSFVERMLWLAFICVALFSIISLSRRTWERFQTSPMVISMDRNKLVWNTSFPSLTVCPHKRIDELKVEDYMLGNEQFFQTEEDKEDFRDFVVKLASLTYENIETLPTNKTFGIPGERYLDLLYELKWNFEPEMSSGAAVKMYIYETLTEFGICHAVNSLVARYNAYEYWTHNNWNLLEHGDRVTVHPLDGEIYAQIINLSTAYDVYFHGAGDIPNISKQRYTFPESDYTTVELIALEIYTAEEARAFTTKQRKCRFQYEAEEMQTVPIYSFGLCLAECRMFFSLKVCGCVPHFYRNRLKSGRVLPVCGFAGLICLTNIKRDIISLKSDRYKINCNCLSNCDDSNFFVQSYRSRVWFLGANLQWGIIDYPKMQLRRDVLFSFADVLVYIGGLVGFFLGCSILSFTEVLYYFTARFVRRMFWN